MKKIGVILLIFFLLVSFAGAVSFSEQDQKYYDKLKKAGLSDEQSARIMEEYPSENDLLSEMRTAVKENKTAVLDISIELLKKDFYKPGVISSSFKKWWASSSYFVGAFNSFFKGLFGDTLTGYFKWIVGVKRDNTSRVLDLIVGFTTSTFLWLIYLIGYDRLFKAKFSSKKEEDEATNRVVWIERLISTWYKRWLLFPGIYFGLFQIPFVNRFLEIITFYHFMPSGYLENIIIRTLFSAMVIGFLPDIALRFAEMRKAKKEADREMQIKASAQILKDMSKVNKDPFGFLKRPKF